MSTLGGIGFRPFDAPTAARTVLTALSWPRGLMTAQGAVVAGTVPVQLDVLKRWDDGSVRHTLAAMRVPALAMGQWAPGTMEPSGVLTGTPVPLTTDVVVMLTPFSGAPVVIDLQTAIATGKLEPWRTGPLVTEARVYIPVPELSPDFELIADVACFPDGTPTRVDIGFSRSLVDVGTADPQMTANLVYDVTITSGGQTASYSLDGCSFLANVVASNATATPPVVATATVIGTINGTPAFNVPMSTLRADGYNLEPEAQLVSLDGDIFTLNRARYSGVFAISTGLTHALGQVWHHTINEQPVHVVQDVDLLRRTGVMIHRRDLGATVPAPVWPPVKPLDPGNIGQYFPATGDRWEIGPIPHQVALWMISQDPGAYLFVLGDARAFSAVPWHLRDRVTGKWLSYTDFPGQHALQLSQSNGWVIDTAHSGCFNTIHWLLTGRRMWLDDLEAQVGASQQTIPNLAPVVVSWPGNPQFTGAQFTQAVTSFQTRGQAWLLRTLLMGAAFIPDSRPMAAYMPGIVQKNIEAMRDYAAYATPLQGQLGLWQQCFAEGTPFGQAAGWTECYFTSVLCWMQDLGFDVKDILAGKAQFLCGPFMGLGMPSNQGACYQTVVYDATGKPIQNWADGWTQRQAAVTSGTQGNVDDSDQTINGDRTYWSLWYGVAGRMLLNRIGGAGPQATLDFINANKTMSNALSFCEDANSQWNPKFAQLL